VDIPADMTETMTTGGEVDGGTGLGAAVPGTDHILQVQLEVQDDPVAEVAHHEEDLTAAQGAEVHTEGTLMGKGAAQGLAALMMTDVLTGMTRNK